MTTSRRRRVASPRLRITSPFTVEDIAKCLTDQVPLTLWILLLSADRSSPDDTKAHVRFNRIPFKVQIVLTSYTMTDSTGTKYPNSGPITVEAVKQIIKHVKTVSIEILPKNSDFLPVEINDCQIHELEDEYGQNHYFVLIFSADAIVKHK